MVELVGTIVHGITMGFPVELSMCPARLIVLRFGLLERFELPTITRRVFGCVWVFGCLASKVPIKQYEPDPHPGSFKV